MPRLPGPGRQENKADLIPASTSPTRNVGSTSILIDLAQREPRTFRPVSPSFWWRSWGRVTLLLLNTHRYAASLLKAPEHPLVLIELDYLSDSSMMPRLLSPPIAPI